jgi:uncharacterized membrane protein (UPF0127 family)
MLSDTLGATFTLACLSLTLLGAACASCNSNTQPPHKKVPHTTQVRVTTENDVVEILAEVVVSQEKRSRGLQFRKELGDGKGMLFVFERQEVQSFWMKDTFIPLDMIFIAQDRTIVGIIHDTKPLLERSLSVEVPSRFVLEVPGGFCRKTGIHHGQQVEFRL